MLGVAILLAQLVLSTVLSAPATIRTPPPPHVLDVAGVPLRAGARYYVLPAAAAAPTNNNQTLLGRGGLTAISEYGSCPFNVIQSPSPLSNGTLLNFRPLDGKSTVRLGTDLNIQFFLVTFCVDLSVWRLGKLDRETQQRFVMLGGTVGHPGPDTLSSWFQIQQGDDGSPYYKLVFCPTVCDSCKNVSCGNIGTYTMNGKRWLVLGDPPLAVKFLRGPTPW